MSADDDKSRSEHLLSKDAIPRIEVPHRDAEPARQFRLPSKVGKPAHTGIDAPPEPPPVPGADQEHRPSGKGGRRRRRPSTGRFRDRTLDWFRIGDALADEESAPDGDYLPEDRSRVRLYAALAGGAVILIILLVWLLS